MQSSNACFSHPTPIQLRNLSYQTPTRGNEYTPKTWLFLWRDYFTETKLSRVVSVEWKREIEWAPRLMKEITFYLNHNSLTTNLIVELKWAILHQIYAQAFESLPRILPGCFSPISSRFHHGHKFVITYATILWKQKVEKCSKHLWRMCEGGMRCNLRNSK